MRLKRWLSVIAVSLVTLGVVNLLWAWNELLIALVFLQDDSMKTLMVGNALMLSRFANSVFSIAFTL